MKCHRCRGKNVVERETNVSAEALFGLPSFVLCGVHERECSDCGARTLGIPRQEQLQTFIAEILSRKTGSFLPNEIEYLRKHMGLSKKDFAEAMGVAYETVVRWESEKSSQSMGSTAERLLRLLVVSKQPPASYDKGLERPERVRLSIGSKGWEIAA